MNDNTTTPTTYPTHLCGEILSDAGGAYYSRRCEVCGSWLRWDLRGLRLYLEALDGDENASPGHYDCDPAAWDHAELTRAIELVEVAS